MNTLVDKAVYRYPIVARAWPSLMAWPSARASKVILHKLIKCIILCKISYRRVRACCIQDTLLSRACGLAAKCASKGILHTNALVLAAA